tara:strand:- start:5972 stop:6250 length:279 start_codon:yes stop_codon:yes gene_type:complete
MRTRTRTQSSKTLWKKWKKKAPKVPDITCPIIDDVLSRIEKHQQKDKVMSQYQWDIIQRRMEQLRTDNELLRESGIYWYNICKDRYKDLKDK